MKRIELDYQEFLNSIRIKSKNISGINWEYLISGDGERVLVILNGGLRVADSAFKYVNLFNSNFKVIVPTYPPLTSLDKMIEGIKVIINDESNEKPFFFCQSYGAMIGECMIQKYPEITGKIILSGVGPIKASIKELFQIKFRTFLISILPNKIVSRIYKKNLLEVITFPESEKTFWEKYLSETFDNNLGRSDALSHFKTSLDALKKYSFKKTNNKYNGEVLILKGENDYLIDQNDIDELQRYFNKSKSKIIPNAGHTSAFQNPREFFNEVVDYLN